MLPQEKDAGGAPEPRTELLQGTDASAHERARGTIQRDDLGSDSQKERLTTHQETGRGKKRGFAQPWIAGGSTGGRDLRSSLQREWGLLGDFRLDPQHTIWGETREPLGTQPLSSLLCSKWAAAGTELEIWIPILPCDSLGRSGPPPTTSCAYQTNISGLCHDHCLAHPVTPSFALSFVRDPSTQHSIFPEWASK